MQKEILDKLTITNLSCFQNDKVVKVERLTNGYSNTCYLVTTLSNRYVAKRFTNNVSLLKESKILALKEISQYVPKVLTLHNQWLIIEFVENITLHDSTIGTEEKFIKALEALSSFHQYTTTIHQMDKQVFSAVDLFELISQLKNKANLTSTTKAFVERVVLSLTVNNQLTSNYNKVLVHGDLNFNNVLIDNQSKKFTLLDFEACHLSDVEYDIGMMCAVNEYPITIIEQQAENIISFFPEINIDLVTRYYKISCIVNALWYSKPVTKCFENDIAISFQQRAATQLSLIKALF